MNHRPANLRPPIRQRLVHHNHIHRPADPADSIAQANGLGDAVLDLALDDQEVQIAVARKLPARSRSEQDHPGWRTGGLHQSLSGQVDQLMRDHYEDSLPAIEGSTGLAQSGRVAGGCMREPWGISDL